MDIITVVQLPVSATDKSCDKRKFKDKSFTLAQCSFSKKKIPSNAALFRVGTTSIGKLYFIINSEGFIFHFSFIEKQEE